MAWHRSLTGSPFGLTRELTRDLTRDLTRGFSEHQDLDSPSRNAEHLPVSHRFFEQTVIPRQEVRRDNEEAKRVVCMFEHLECIANSESQVSWQSIVVPTGLVAAYGVLPRLLHLINFTNGTATPHPHLPLSDFGNTMLAHAAAALLAYAALGPVLLLASALVLRVARLRNSQLTTRFMFLNSIVLREERAALCIFCAWSVNFSWWSSARHTRWLLARPCMALLLLCLTSAVRKAFEFAFLASKLQIRFEADVMTSAFERAALQRLLQLPCADPAQWAQTLQAQPVLPDAELPHAFERHTADMLRRAFGCGPPELPANEASRRRLLSRGPTMVVLPPTPARVVKQLSLPGRASFTMDNLPSPRSFASANSKTPYLLATELEKILGSSTMFLMGDSKIEQMEDFAKALFRHLCDNQAPVRQPSTDTREAEHTPRLRAQSFDRSISSSDSSTGSEESKTSKSQSQGAAHGRSQRRNRSQRLFRLSNLDRAMPEEDAKRARQMLTWAVAAAPGSCAADVHSISEPDFISSLSSMFERFHMLAATVKDYAAIWLIFSNVAAALQNTVAFVVILSVLMPPEVLKAFGITTSTAFLALSFVFGGFAREIFESVVLILVVHPYDVGDRIRVFDKLYMVQKINILTTEVRDLSNQCVYLKNSALYHETTLVNLQRSLNAVVELSFQVSSANVSEHAMVNLNNFVQRYIMYEDKTWVPTYFRSYTPVVDGGTAFCDLSGSTTLRIRLMHRVSWQNIREIRQDTTEILYAVVGEMRRLKLDFNLPTQPVLLHVDREVLPEEAVPLVSQKAQVPAAPRPQSRVQLASPGFHLQPEP